MMNLKTFPPKSVCFSPQSLVVDLHHADGDLIVPVWSFLRHLGEQQAQSSLVDAGVVDDTLNTQTEGAESTGSSELTWEATLSLSNSKNYFNSVTGLVFL